MAKKEKAAAAKKADTATKEVTAAPKSGGKPGIVIIIVIIAVLCLVCGGLGVGGYLIYKKAKENTKDAFNGGFTDLIEESIEDGIEEESGGDSDFSFGGELPSDFPSDVPVYPDSEIGISYSTDDDSKENMYVSLSTTDSVNDVVAFYEEEVVSEGWDITKETKSIGFSIIAEKGDRDLTVYIYDGEDGKTYYRITING